VIDVGKAIAALLTNAGDLCEYLEVIGLGKDLNNVSAPFIAIPTTAGTGAEVTRNAVIVSLSHHVKVSMRSPVMLPRLAVVDPELTYSLPRSITASTGLDALTQLMEAFVTHRANPLTDGFCREGLVRATRALRTAYEKGDPQSRADMSLASLLSGLALANAGLGAVHGLAGPLGGMFPAPHGIVCARLLPIVIERNILALSSRCADSPALERYAEIARICTGHAAAQADDGMTWLQELCSFLAVPGLASFGMREQDIPAIVQQTQMASSMKANPIPLTDAELSSILKRAL
jgi:alcohol dehydrogenase class IV